MCMYYMMLNKKSYPQSDKLIICHTSKDVHGYTNLIVNLVIFFCNDYI